MIPWRKTTPAIGRISTPGAVIYFKLKTRSREVRVTVPVGVSQVGSTTEVTGAVGALGT
jgi:hypothetical protein